MKNKTTAGLLALFLGGIGSHKFYLRENREGFLYLIFTWTMIPALLAIFDAVHYFRMSPEDFNKKYNGGEKTPMSLDEMKERYNLK